MKIFNFKLIAAAATCLTFGLTSCDNDDDKVIPNQTANTTNGKITLNFDNKVGENDLVLKASYQNAAGETYTVDMLNYYISNIRLKTTDGREFVQPQDESYFLVKESSAASQEITINNVPSGDYTEISFILGVDSLRSVSDISKRTGVLDPAATGDDKMYWSWSSGYVFFKMEGTSPQAPAGNNNTNPYQFHIGGFGGYTTKAINNIRTIKLTAANTTVKVTEKNNPKVHIVTDIEEVFKNPQILKIADNPIIMAGANTTKIADNYTDMFSIDHIHN